MALVPFEYRIEKYRPSQNVQRLSPSAAIKKVQREDKEKGQRSFQQREPENKNNPQENKNSAQLPQTQERFTPDIYQALSSLKILDQVRHPYFASYLHGPTSTAHMMIAYHHLSNDEDLLNWGAYFARLFHTQIHVLHCASQLAPKEWDEIKKECLAILEPNAPELMTLNHEPIFHWSKHDQVSKALLAYENQHGIQLTLISPKKKTNLEQWILGSVTEEFFKACHSPLFIAPEHCSQKKIQRILCPIENPEFSRAALTEALHLAEVFQAELDLIHISDSKESLNKEHYAIRDFMSELNWNQNKEHFVSQVGSVNELLIQYVKEKSFDLMILKTHPQTGHSAHKSHTLEIIKELPCPLWILK